MINILTLKRHIEGGFVTEISSNGAQIWERHSPMHSDETVLSNILNRQYYQHVKGKWAIVLDADNHRTEGSTFADAISLAIRFIELRDNPYWGDQF